MASPTRFRLDRVRIQNFRCFSDCDISFHSDLTVLIADNGQGKTTIMDAAIILLGQLIDELTIEQQSDGIATSDIRLAAGPDGLVSPQLPTVLEAKAIVNGAEINWTAERKIFEKRDRRSGRVRAAVTDAVDAIRSALQPQGSQVSLFPMVSYYPSDRFSKVAHFGNQPHRKPLRLPGRFSGYRDFLDPLSDSRHFNEWYEQKFMAVRTRAATGAHEEESPLLLLTAVRAAVEDVLEPTGWGRINWDLTQRCVVLEHRKHGRLPLASLSSGVRKMVALTADLAYRCALLNPSLGEAAARGTPGIVLIDEVDLHLHPGWQQRVVELLQRAFRTVQFIFSTHSPQLLSTVKAESIRTIRVSDSFTRIEMPSFQTRGVESANVLAQIMGVDSVPQVPEASWLSDYRAMIEESTQDEKAGKFLREKLVNHFGAQHPVILDCDRLARFSEFKRKRVPLGGNNAHT